MSTHNIPFFNMKKKNTRNYSKSAAMGFFSKGLKNEFERAMVNKPSVFEPLKFYCICDFLFAFLDGKPQLQILGVSKFCVSEHLDHHPQS